VRGWSSLLALATLLSAGHVQADGGFPDPRQVLLPGDAPEQIIVATNFGLLFSEDAGTTWSFSCEQRISAYASSYILGAPPQQRIFALTSGAGLIYSDDGSCTWTAATGSLSDVLPYAVAVDPSDARRVYVIGVARGTLSGDESIYVSDDGGVTFAGPVFTAPAQSAILNIVVAPSRPSTLFASMFSAPQNHPSLLRSRDSGESWEVVADLVDHLGDVPFELLGVAQSDEDRLFVRILGPSAETLAVSDDGGLSFVPSVSIPGKLSAFLELASGTILVGGTSGTEAVGYRSVDDAKSFEPWPAAPHVHALAERNGQLYVAADNFADGYAVAVSDDEGASLTPLFAFEDVRAVKSCVAGACAESCAYYADINLWSSAVCGPPASTGDPPDPVDAPETPTPVESPPEVEPSAERASPGPVSDSCTCHFAADGRPGAWSGLLLAAAALLALRGGSRRAARQS
jgi:hypothetical protein